MFNEIRFSSDIRSNQWMDEGVTMSGDWLPFKELVYIYIMRWENSVFLMAQEWFMSNLGIIDGYCILP